LAVDDPSERPLWFCAERLEHVRALFPRSELDCVAELQQQHPEQPPDVLAAQVVRAHLEISGPTTTHRLVSAIGLSSQQVAAALGQLEAEGFALRGSFDPRLEGEQYCCRRLLSRIHGYTQARLRREIEPVTAQQFMHFLLDFHGLAQGQRRRGRGGLLRAIEQLQGFEAGASRWEAELLPARVKGFEPAHLDELCWSGEVTWGRLTPRGSASDRAWASFSRATPITLAIREDFQWLLRAVRGQVEPESSPKSTVSCVIEALHQRGASFFAELRAATGLGNDEIEDALWDNVARGLITSDGFAPLRSLLRSRAPETTQLGGRVDRSPRVSRGLRRGARREGAREGRWALIDRGSSNFTDDELAEAAAEQLLARYGVLFRDLIDRESLALPWRDVIWALRRLEARGQIRGGRFVNGFVGEQYALPRAIERLRELRRLEPTSELIHVSAADPLNLVGIVVPGPRVSAGRGGRVSYRDGAFVESPHDADSSPGAVAARG